MHFVQGAISGVLFEVMPWPDPAARNVSPKLNVRAQGAISGVLFEVMPWPDPAARFLSPKLNVRAQGDE